MKPTPQPLEQIFAGLPDAALILSPDAATIQDCNPAAAALFGFTQEEMQGRKVASLYTDQDASPHPLMQRKDGTAFPVQSSLIPLTGDDGKPVANLLILRDLTTEVWAQAALQTERDRLFSVLDKLPATVYLQASDYSITFANRRFRERYGDPADRPCYEILHGRDQPCEVCNTFHVFETGEPRVWERTTFDGRPHIIYADLLPGLDGPDMVLEIRVDLSEREPTQGPPPDSITHDPLTDLPNRLQMEERLIHALAQARRTQQPVALIVLDLDDFEYVNATFGRDKGDMALIEVASRLLECSRRSDTVARLKSDLFALVLEDLNNVQDAAVVAQKILSAFSRPFLVDGYEIIITASLGISLHPQDGDQADTLLKQAEATMRRVKEAGKNSYQFYR